MSAQDILKMIEEVDPSDTAKLDEIDARVWCWIEGIRYIAHESWGDGNKRLAVFGEKGYWIDRYTRSRDALKAIRPEGWNFNVYFGCKGWEQPKFYWCASAGKREVNKYENVVYTDNLPTEELAELHSIIQTIKHERTK